MKLIIDIEPRYCKDMHSEIKEQYYEAINRIIEAVDNGIPYEPKGDLISREVLKEEMQTEIASNPQPDTDADYYVGVKQGLKFAETLIEKASTVEPEITQGEWISVSERLPKDRDWYLGIFQETDTGWVNPIPFVCDYLGKTTKCTTQDGWIIHNCTDEDTPHEYYTKLLKCMAWQPLPEPYKKEGAEE